MDVNDLPNKPLAEAIFELRWELQGQDDGTLLDPHFHPLLSRFFNKMEKDFPFWHKLPAADVPINIVPHTPLHQFREEEGTWPLMQIGPGILTVNDTTDYTWASFRKICDKACKALLATYPDAENSIKISSIKLRYLNGDLLGDKHFTEFMKDLKVNVSVTDKMFLKNRVSGNMTGANIQMGFETIRPKGSAYLKFGSGKKNNDPAVLWETGVVSTPGTWLDSKGIKSWLVDAHHITHNWFLSLTEGPLIEGYK